MTLRKKNIHTISSPVEIIDGSKNTTIVLPSGTTLHIDYALLSGRSKRNLLRFKDVFTSFSIRCVIRPSMKS